MGWIRDIVAQCKAANVPAFVKQLGAKPRYDQSGQRYSIALNSRKGGDMDEWPDDLRVREFPEVRS